MRRERLRVGVIGAGVIGQVMHLPYLAELDDRFEIAVLCDASRAVVEACGDRFQVRRRVTDWRAVLDEELDAVLVLTSGSHAPIATAASQAALHVFVEKPMCFSIAEGREMIEAAERAGRVLMVGYPKRYDPAFRRARAEVQSLADLRFVRVTTTEAPYLPYVSHYPLVGGDDVDPALVSQWRADSSRRLGLALAGFGPLDEQVAGAYATVLLDSMVHELNLLRGVLGEPDELRYARIRGAGTTVVLDFSGVECVLAWIDLPGMTRYEMEASFYDPDERVRLAFPSPYLRSAPTIVELECGKRDEIASRVSREVTAYESAFKLELVEFYRAVSDGTPPETPGSDALRDVALCQSVVEAATTGRPVLHPSDPARAGLG